MTSRTLCDRAALLLFLLSTLAFQTSGQAQPIPQVLPQVSPQQDIQTLDATVRAALEQDPTNLKVYKQIEAAAKNAGTRGDVRMHVQCLCALARAQIELGDLKRSRSLLEQAAESARTLQRTNIPRGVTHVSFVATREVELCRVAFEYFRGNLTREGLDVLREAADDAEGARGTNGRDGGLVAFANHPVVSGMAAQLHRRLVSLPIDERYELLHSWVLPKVSATRTSRLFQANCPTLTPPQVFARALGERPNRSSFVSPTVGAVSGIFSIEWQLVASAKEHSRIPALITEIRERLEAQTASVTGDPEGTTPSSMLKLIQSSPSDLDFLLLLAELTIQNPSPELQRSIAARLVQWQMPIMNQSLVRVYATRDGLPHAMPGVRDATTNVVTLASEIHAFDRLVARSIVLAAAALRHEAHWQSGESLLDAYSQRLPEHIEPSWALHCKAKSARSRNEDSDESLYEPRPPQHWLQARAASMLGAGSSLRSEWTSHDQHILHWNSTLPSGLLFRYPLEGDFRFSFEASTTDTPKNFSAAWGGVFSGGKGVSANNYRVNVLDPLMSHSLDRTLRFDFFRSDFAPTYNRISVDVKKGRSVVSINNHRAVEYDNVLPWIGLRSVGAGMVAYRGIEISGAPTIPREVQLSNDPLLRGWSTTFYYRSRPPLREATTPTAEPSGLSGLVRSIFGSKPQKPVYDWQMDDGVLVGQQRSVSFDATAESVLSQLRPLAAGETISYEFFYQPGVTETHPALGRVAMLIDPRGAQLHWLSNGPNDASGLGSSNQVADFLNRRGPKVLPLKSGDWNRAELSRTEKRATLKLNDVEILQLPLQNNAPQTFGLFYDQSRFNAKVRNVILRGDWPTSVPTNVLENDRSLDTKASNAAMVAMVSDELLVENALSIHQQAIKLADKEAYELLSRWVLPNATHGLRLAGAFSAVNPIPGSEDDNGLDQQRLADAQAQGRTRVDIGGNLVAPAMTLLTVARRLGKIDEVRHRVNAAPVNTDLERRSKLAMLTMLAIGDDDGDAALKRLSDLYPLVVMEQQPHGPFAELRRQRWQRWPDVLAITAAIGHPKTRELADSMSQHLYVEQVRTWKWSCGEPWDRQVQSLSNQARHIDKRGALTTFHTPPSLKTWDVVPDSRARTRGLGFPRTHWDFDQSGLRKFSPHRDDRVYFNTPFRGNYEIEFEVPIFNWQESHVMTAGSWAVLRYDLDKIRNGNLRSSVNTPIAPFLRPDNRIHLRIVVNANEKVTYCNGREIHRVALPADYDPWLLCRSGNNQLGGIHNLRITGEPKTPEEINLLPPEMTGWVAYCGHRGVNYSGRTWWLDGETLRGSTADGGGAAEQSIRYHRPMLEDGVVRYEFLYATNNQNAHPAMDRLVFLMRPDGIAEHWLTNDKHDLTYLDPLNVTVNKKFQRGDGVPLREGDWNRVEMRLKGDTITLAVNEQVVYERPLERTNSRHIGLFYYMDREQASVRNLFWKGDWPKQVPPATEQELYRPDGKILPQPLDKESHQSFQHKFSGDTFPSDRFDVLGDGGSLKAVKDGLHFHCRSDSEHTYRHISLAPRLSLQGDFDITVRYEDLKLDLLSEGHASALLTIVFDNEYGGHTQFLSRRVRSISRSKDLHRAQSAIRIELEDGAKQRWPGEVIQESISGRLRLQRRKDVIFVSFAENDSNEFQYLWEETAKDQGWDSWGIRFGVQVMADGTADVVYKDIEVRASSLTERTIVDPASLLATINQQKLKLTKAWGSDFRKEQLEPRRWQLTNASPASIKQNDQGLQLSGTVTMTPNAQFSGDFELAFDTGQLTFPSIRGQYSDLNLRLVWGADAAQEIAEVSVSKAERICKLQVRRIAPNKDASILALYPVDAGKPMQIRMARRGAELFILDGDEVIARMPCPTTPLDPGGLRIKLQSGSEETPASGTLRQVQFHAESVVF